MDIEPTASHHSPNLGGQDGHPPTDPPDIPGIRDLEELADALELAAQLDALEQPSSPDQPAGSPDRPDTVDEPDALDDIDFLEHEAWLDEDDDPCGYRELEDLRSVPPLRRPEDMPRVRTQADLHRHWRALVGQLGFSQPRLYVQFFEIDGTCTPLILDITELPDLSDGQMFDAHHADALMRVCSSALDDFGTPGMRVGILFVRPGRRASGRAVDRAWARGITMAARRHGVPIFPVHVANDQELTVVSPDDLLRPA